VLAILAFTFTQSEKSTASADSELTHDDILRRIKHHDEAMERLKTKPINPPLPEWNTNKNYCLDSLLLFRKKPGDAGWIPGRVIAQAFPGKNEVAFSYLNSTRLAFHHYLLFPDSKYKIFSIFTGGFAEDVWIKKLLDSGLFQYASRESEGAGPGDTSVTVSSKTIFSESPNEKEAKVFIESVIAQRFSAPELGLDISEVIRAKPFFFQIEIFGNGKYLATGDKKYWEHHKIQFLFYQKWGKINAIGIQLGIYDSKIAKGPENQRPPKSRFESYENYHNIQALLTKIASDLASKDEHGVYSTPDY
jgi:hypothetical protein